MAASKTSAFWLTESVMLGLNDPDGSRFTGTIDLGAYVDVGDQQAVAIEEVDVIWQQGSNYGTDVNTFLAGAGSLAVQLTDLSPGGVFVRADDSSLIASGSLNIAAGVTSHSNDFIPDTFGKGDSSRIVVNDNLYITTGPDGAAIGVQNLFVTVRIKARVVKLTTKDWMAIAIQSTAADN